MVEAVRDIDVVIHTGQPPPALPADVLLYEEMLLDLATRGTHVLCQAAVEAGVKRLVYGSTLEVFGDYPDTVFVTEHYKPLPTTEPRVLAQYLGEVVCREFARDYEFTATALRLGRLVWEEDLVGGKPDLLWLDIRDAASAFVQAIERDDSDSLNWVVRWAVYHICAPVPNAKFLIGRAEGMGYAPKRDLQVGAR
jgi:nucleoside-diphosphate-sugar epimerase